jgi:DoxX-like family
MSIAYAVVNFSLAAALATCALAEFTLFDEFRAQMVQAKVPPAWLPVLATVKLVALVGIVAGFWVPAVGTAAAIGVAGYFVVAIVKHVAANDSNVFGAIVFLVLAGAALTLRVAASDAFGLGVFTLAED